VYVFTFGTLQRSHFQQSGSPRREGFDLANGTDRLSRNFDNSLFKFTGVKNKLGGQILKNTQNIGTQATRITVVRIQEKHSD